MASPWIVDERVIEYAFELHCSGLKKHALRAQLSLIAGEPLETVAFERVYAECKRRLRNMELQPGDYRKKLTNFYESIMSEEDNSVRDRLLAANSLADVVGASAKYADQGSPDVEASKIRKLVDEMDAVDSQSESSKGTS